MCFMTSQVRSAAKWNWGGDTIVQSPIIPSSQRVPQTRIKYDVDIREYILGRENAVLRRSLDELVGSLPQNEQHMFLSRSPGSFDFRMRAVTAYVYENVRFQVGERRHDAWLYPDQTLAKQSGDCEDRAFLMASLLIASGISSYVVRVALGKLYRRKSKIATDHAWVMYRNEEGMWMIIEPLLYTKDAYQHTRSMPGEKSEESIEYIPYYVFNNDHLWRIRSNTEELTFNNYLDSRTFWNKFDPSFAAAVHNSVFDQVLETELPWYQQLYIKQVSLAIDLNPTAYDPRDHFDNGYIEESWERLQKRIQEKTLDGLALAGHAIGDFYAHTSYAHFGKVQNNSLELFDGNMNSLTVDYASGVFNVGKGSQFTTNEPRCSMLPDERVTYCTQQKIISGRFAQPDDPHQSTLEKMFIYIPYELRNRADFASRCCLPHHDEIAVDDEIDDGSLPSRHVLYTPDQFRKQFRLRKAAAIHHFRQLYQRWRELSA